MQDLIHELQKKYETLPSAPLYAYLIRATRVWKADVDVVVKIMAKDIHFSMTLGPGLFQRQHVVRVMLLFKAKLLIL